MGIIYRPEAAEDADAIERVLDRAFGPGRFAKTSERVRERGAVLARALSRIALAPRPEALVGSGAFDSERPPTLSQRGEEIVGVCRMWRIRVGENDALFLGPLGVDPATQHGGVGAALVRACVEAAEASAEHAIVCVGSATFFAPMGFSVIPPGRVAMPGPVDASRFLWRELKAGASATLSGAVL